MFQVGAAALGVIAGLGSQSAQGQAPGLLWTTNVGARVFAVDAQTNVYANAGGAVVELNAGGGIVQSNAVCPLTGFAQRDSAGNFYFSGSFDGTQDFGGIVLSGGYHNPNWSPGWPSGFLAKYGSAGNLLWATKFGVDAGNNLVTDLLLELSGACYVGFYAVGQNGHLAHFNSGGAFEWNVADGGIGQMSHAGMRLGGLTASNCCFISFRINHDAVGGRANTSGNITYWADQAQPLQWSTDDATNGKPVIDDLGRTFQAGICNPSVCPTSEQVLRKYPVSGSIVWNVPIGAEEQWVLARDAQANVYLAGAAGLFAKYDPDGNLIWTTNYGQKCVAMIVDAAGNRFISFSNGAVARLANDPPPALPSITSGPQSQTVFVGDPLSLSVTAGGTPPLRYAWRLYGTNLPNATNSVLNLSPATVSKAGPYSVVVSNAAGAMTSAPPAVVRVKQVELYLGSQLLTNGTYTFATPPTLSVHSAFANGSIYYTLDGSTPDFGSAPYSGPFTLTHSATVRAIGYSANFAQSEEADIVNAIVVVNHKLTASASGGGSVTLNPPGGTYASTNIVTATGVASNGWSFLYWLGDASGTNATVNISMERDKTIYAVFGTVLSTSVAGNGAVQLNPPGGLYPFGSVVRLTGVPPAGNYFGAWGNAASGNTNPLYFTITTPNPTVSSIFGALSAGQAALTVMINGSGRVNVNPRANVYGTSQTVALTAAPDAGQSFLNWSGDASGTLNPLSVLMSQSKVITANFSIHPALRVSQSGLEGLTADGFRFTLLSDPQMIWQILGSSNLSSWQYLGTVTNVEGQVQFTDPGALSLPNRFYRAAPGP